jgi:hypothetical protein
MTLQPPPTPQPAPEAAPAQAAPPPPPAPPAAYVPQPPTPVAFGDQRVEQVPISFWQQPFVQNGLPFVTSLILHLSVIILLAMLIRPFVAPPGVSKEQIIVPDAEMVTNQPAGGIPHPGLGGDPTRDAAQDQFPDVPRDTKGIAEKPGPTLQASLMTGGGAGDESGAQIIGIGAGALGKGRGTGAGAGAGFGSGDGDNAGALAPFGVPGGGGGIGPKLSFIGMSGSAKRIAYVCDASGSMLNMFDALRFELRKSIEGLKPVQAFNVIFFQDQGFATVDKDRLMVANPDSKRKAYDFLDKFFVRGETNPIPALELAFKQQPELIYLLTDGDFSGPGNDAVINFCKMKTADGKTKIMTLAFVNKESRGNPQDLEFIKVLQTIAKNSGGEFRMVSEEDMGGR